MPAGHALGTAFASCLARAVLLAISALMCGSIAANAAPLRIVAIGASNTHGWYVGNQGAYPAQLQALLRAKGIDDQVTNAEVPFDTTAMMLRRIDKDVPNGTDSQSCSRAETICVSSAPSNNVLPTLRKWNAGCALARLK